MIPRRNPVAESDGHRAQCPVAVDAEPQDDGHAMRNRNDDEEVAHAFRELDARRTKARARFETTERAEESDRRGMTSRHL